MPAQFQRRAERLPPLGKGQGAAQQPPRTRPFGCQFACNAALAAESKSFQVFGGLVEDIYTFNSHITQHLSGLYFLLISVGSHKKERSSFLLIRSAGARLVTLPTYCWSARCTLSYLSHAHIGTVIQPDILSYCHLKLHEATWFIDDHVVLLLV